MDSLGNDMEVEIVPILTSCEEIKGEANSNADGLLYYGTYGTCKEDKQGTQKGRKEFATLHEVV